MTYKVADGWNNAAGLADLDPQPRTPGMLEDERRRSVGRSGQFGGLYTELRYSVLDVDEYTALCTDLGVLNAATNEVTMRLLTRDRDVEADYNCIVEAPQNEVDTQFSLSFYRDVVFNVIIFQEAEAP
jgi:hypothetical protein